MSLNQVQSRVTATADVFVLRRLSARKQINTFCQMLFVQMSGRWAEKHVLVCVAALVSHRSEVCLVYGALEGTRAAKHVLWYLKYSPWMSEKQSE